MEIIELKNRRAFYWTEEPRFNLPKHMRRVGISVTDDEAKAFLERDVQVRYFPEDGPLLVVRIPEGMPDNHPPIINATIKLQPWSWTSQRTGVLYEGLVAYLETLETGE